MLGGGSQGTKGTSPMPPDANGYSKLAQFRTREAFEQTPAWHEPCPKGSYIGRVPQ